MIPDGYTDLAPGKIASVVTYLEMTVRPALPDVSVSGVSLRRVENPRLDWYRALYRRAGEQWFWFSRLEMADENLAALLNRPTTELFVGACDGREVGMAELDRSNAAEVEITSFALFGEAIGKGLGRAFMNESARCGMERHDRARMAAHLHAGQSDGARVLSEVRVPPV